MKTDISRWQPSMQARLDISQLSMPIKWRLPRLRVNSTSFVLSIVLSCVFSAAWIVGPGFFTHGGLREIELRVAMLVSVLIICFTTVGISVWRNIPKIVIDNQTITFHRSSSHKVVYWEDIKQWTIRPDFPDLQAAEMTLIAQAPNGEAYPAIFWWEPHHLNAKEIKRLDQLHAIIATKTGLTLQPELRDDDE